MGCSNFTIHCFGNETIKRTMFEKWTFFLKVFIKFTLLFLWLCSQTMFELISGYGVWHRRYFVLEGCNMYYWNHPNDKESKVWTHQQLNQQTNLTLVAFKRFSFTFCFNLLGSRGQHVSLQLSQSVCQACQEGLVCSTFHLWAGEQRPTSAAGWEGGSLSQVSFNKTWLKKTNKRFRSDGELWNDKYTQHILRVN